MRLLISAIMLCCLCLTLAGQQLNTGELAALARKFEPVATATAPAWSRRQDAPLFQAAWLSDLHITDEGSLALCTAALRTIGSRLKPQAVFITGDNCGIAARPADNGNGTARYRFLKQLLDKELNDIPVHIIPGDNWPQGFSAVYGAQRRAFSMHGYRFIFLTPDEHGYTDGCGIFTRPVWKWLDDELAAARDVPALLVTHYPVLPASFLDAPKLRQKLKGTSVVGVLSGHLHLDLNAALDGVCRQWMAPAVGRSHRPAFKLLSFYRDAVIAAAYEWNESEKEFVQVNKFLRIQLPANLQIEGNGKTLPPSEMPAAELRRNKSLDSRIHEVNANVQNSMLEFGVQNLPFGSLLRRQK